MQINAREKVEAALDAINRHGDAINGMITVTADLAREAADEVLEGLRQATQPADQSKSP